MFKQYQQEKKSLILKELKEFFTKQKQGQLPYNPWGNEVFERLTLSLQNGKMIRGTLVFLGSEIQKSQNQESIVSLALAIELMHTGLLIHDDIMDNAESRRGLPTLHVSYSTMMQQKKSRYPKNTGRALAICVGDAAFFLGFQLLSHYKNKEISQQLTSLYAKELHIVTTAQMFDISLGASSKPGIKLEDILSMYQEKTGRYSIYLPLIVGATCTNEPQSTCDHLKKFSDHIGIAYQLIDDTLDLFGSKQDTGKAVGQDIREGKQTPYMYYLHTIGDSAINTRLESLFSKGDISEEDLAWVQQTIRAHHIDTKIHSLIKLHTDLSLEAIQKIPMNNTQTQLFSSFVEYVTNRIQ